MSATRTLLAMTGPAAALRGCVVALALYHFLDNSADPDLWGHTFFGRRLLEARALDATEPFSWTAAGHPWVNHEVLAEAAMGAAHQWAGSAGLLLLKTAVGLLAFGLALGMGTRGGRGGERLAAWALGALAVVEIGFGFAARPQIFTALFLAVLLWLLRALHEGRRFSVWLLPPLFVLWVNTHGGVMLGLCVLIVAAGATTAETVWHGRRSTRPEAGARRLLLRSMLALWGLCALCALALLVNPRGVGLIRWLAGSVAWVRPIVEEWNPTPLGWDHAPMFAVLGLTVAAFALTRRPRRFWELAVAALLAAAALRHVRHTPLFCLAALSFAPPHLADVAARFRAHAAGLEARWPAVRRPVTAVLWLAAAAMLAAAAAGRSRHPLRMEVPRDSYAVSAVEFIRQHGLKGNLIVFFDWGEECLWELPRCAVSIDGRLDTCYPQTIIEAHWRLYNGDPLTDASLDVDRADVALLHGRLVGTEVLAARPGWTVAYRDPLATVLVREASRFPALAGLRLPVERGNEAIEGRAPFPDGAPERERTPCRTPNSER